MQNERDLAKLAADVIQIVGAQKSFTRPLPREAFDLIVEFAGFRGVLDTVQRAQRHDHLSVLLIEQWARAAMCANMWQHAGIEDIQLSKVLTIFQVSKDKPDQLDRIRKLTKDASNNVAEAKAVIAALLRDAEPATPTGLVSPQRPVQSHSDQAGPANLGGGTLRSVPVQRVHTAQGGTRAPVHATPVPPPTQDDPRTLHPERRAARPAAASAAHEHAAPPTRNGVRDMSERFSSDRHDRPFEEERDHRHDDARFDSRSQPHADSESQFEKPAAPRDRKFDQVVIYGRDSKGSTALQFDCSPNKDGDALTINISIARAKGARTQDGVDWAKKHCLMLSPGECVLMLNVLLGTNKTFRGAGHGPNNKVWFQAMESERMYAGGIFVTVANGDDQRGCSINPGDLVPAICIFQRAVLDQNKAFETKIEPLSMTQILRRAGQMYDLALQSEEQRKAKKAARG